MLPESLRAKSLVSLAQADIVCPPSYIEPSVLPVGGQLILASTAKTGKSFMMLELGRALASADVPFAAPDLFCPRPCKVLLIEQELGEFSLKKRSEKVYTPEEIKRQSFMAENFLYISKQPELRIDTAKGLALIDEIIAENDPEILMLDPLGRFHNINENDNQEVAGLLATLDKLQKRYPRLSLIMSMHMGKPPDQRAGFDLLDPYRIRGASKFYDNVDSVITANRTHELATPWEAWSLTARFTLRHGESPDDMIIHVNEHNDSRARYYKTVGKDGPVAITSLKKKEPREEPMQYAFKPAS